MVPRTAGPTDAGTPRIDRETYTITERDVGFKAIGPQLGKMLERELAALQQGLRATRI